MPKPLVRIKRIYNEPSKEDGFRILVDRLWPRGLSKKKAKVDLWLKDVAPSDSLRKWFNHDPKKWEEFIERYSKELSQNKALQELKKTFKDKKVISLLFGAKDETHNNAVALKIILNK